MSALVQPPSHLGAGPRARPTPPSSGNGASPAAATTTTCPLAHTIEYELVELVEVVTQDKEKWVKGAAMDRTDTAVPMVSVTRTDKEGSDYKQFINLDHDLEDQPKRHPEYGREICLRARIKRKDGKTDQLAGVTVNFAYKRTDGPDRQNPSAPEPAVWKGADLTGDDKEGFGSKNGTASGSATTDDKGWTPVVSFFLSQYAGDKFKFSATLATGTPGATTPPTLMWTPTNFIVWRKFWYQMTYASGYTPPQPTKAATAYKEVGTDFIKADDKVFTITDMPGGLQARTFYIKFHVEQSGGTSRVAVIGAHNKQEFAKMRTADAARPFKANLIICEFQCDPGGENAVGIHQLTSDNQAITLAQGTGGPIVCKPALKAGAALLVTGEWSLSNAALWTKGGDLTDANIAIAENRASTLTVNVKQAGTMPTPTAIAPVYVKLQVQTAKDFLGESFGKGQILCVYQSTAPAGTSGTEQDFNDTVAHEAGHMWNQTPKPTVQPGSLENHPLQYVGHGGSGSHCRHGATVPATPMGVVLNWQADNQDAPSPADGNCLMYHSFSTNCSHKFCPVCKTYLRLQDMSHF